jgi:hypothetical protein
VITTMPRPRPPFLSREVSRHGRAVWYVRRNGKRIRLRAEFGTPEFDAEYQMALAAHRPATEVRTTAGTLGSSGARPHGRRALSQRQPSGRGYIGRCSRRPAMLRSRP